MSKYEGINQDIEIELSILVFSASPYAASNNATNIQVSETRDSWEDSPEF